MKFQSTGDVARRWNCSRETVKNKLKSGELQAYGYVGGRAIFTEHEIKQYEERQAAKTATQVAA